jgi:hypothetical protein
MIGALRREHNEQRGRRVMAETRRDHDETASYVICEYESRLCTLSSSYPVELAKTRRVALALADSSPRA